jgi:hypothetical protein
VADGMVWRCRGTNSIARRSPPCQAASVRGQSNQELSEVLRAGRESTAGLSPLSTPDSFLMCYQKYKPSGVEELVACTQIGAKWVTYLELVASFQESRRGAPWPWCRASAADEGGAVRKLRGTRWQRV